MKVTERIADIILKGQPVTLPGIGTLHTRKVAPRYDEATRTFLPAREEVVLEPNRAAGQGLIDAIAKRERMDRAAAEQMLRGIDKAVAEAFERDGQLTFPGVGILAKGPMGYTFIEAPERQTLYAPLAQPIEVPQTYTPTRDPFAEPEPEPLPEPEPEPEPLPEPQPEPLPEPESEPQPEPEPEPLPEPEPEIDSQPSQNPQPEPEPEPEPEIDSLQALEELQQQPVPEPEKPAKKKKGFPAWLWVVIALLLIGGGAGAWYFLAGGDQVVANLLTRNDSTPTLDDQQLAEILDEDTPADLSQPSQPSQNSQSSQPSQPNYFLFTLNDDLFTYESSEIAGAAQQTSAYLADFLAAYASAQRYSSAADLLRQRAESYAAERLGELLEPVAASPARYINTDGDYIRRFLTDNLRLRKVYRARHTVQAEIMSADWLARVLDQIVVENELQKDAAQAAPAQPADQPFRPSASYRTASKQGFDVIAGFFTVKQNADRLATQLKRQGCDAYVIEINHGYYVSMGSKSSRTEVEKLYQHLKEWYTGDMAIKQF